MKLSKYKFFFIITISVFIIFSLPVKLFGHLRFLGPDPYFSFQIFPQDVTLFKKGSSIFLLNFVKRGWMGNLDHPAATPSPSYIDSEGMVVETDSKTNRLKSEFKGVWNSFSITVIPYVYKKKELYIMPLLDINPEYFSLKASGTAYSDHDNNEVEIPFSSSLSQNNSDFSAGFLIAKKIKSRTLGLRFLYRNFKESEPKGFINYEYDNNSFSLNRFNWGWSVMSSCNHIFGPSTNIDSFWQDEYVDTDREQFDISMGMSGKRNKAAVHIRRIGGYTKFFEYDEDNNIYEEMKWKVKKNRTTVRAFDVIKIKKIGKGILYFTGLAEFDIENSPVFYKGVELEEKYSDKVYGFEFLPFIHFDLNDEGFIRIGSSVSFFKSHFEHTDVWGSQKVFSSGWTQFDWEEEWEQESYGNNFIFTNFSEMDAEIILNNRTGLKLISHVWSHLTVSSIKKIYGKNESGNEGVYNFIQKAQRKTYKQELWIGGTFGIQRGKKNIIGIFVELPLHYDLYLSTEVSGEEDKYFKGISNVAPAIRKPFVIKALFVINL